MSQQTPVKCCSTILPDLSKETLEGLLEQAQTAMADYNHRPETVTKAKLNSLLVSLGSQGGQRKDESIRALKELLDKEMPRGVPGLTLNSARVRKRRKSRKKRRMKRRRK